MPVRRWGAVALLVIANAAASGCGGGSPVTAAPLVHESWVASGGLPETLSSPTGISLRYIEGDRLGIGIVLRNSSRRKVTVLDARTVEPPRSLVHQIGTRLVPWNPRPCPPRVYGCLQQTFFDDSFDRTRPTPMTVVPGKAVGVQLNFQLGSCAEVPFASSAPTELLRVSLRSGQGQLGTETVPLGDASLRLAPPAASVCLPRPHSRIALSGFFPSSTDSTIPGNRNATCTRTAAGGLACSDGDRCTRTAGGGLLFRSGLFLTGSSPMIRVAIRLPRFHGVGLYRAPPGAAQVLVDAGIGNAGSNGKTYLARTSVVTVTRATGAVFGGRLDATLLGYRRTPFRVQGTWGCAAIPRARFFGSPLIEQIP